MDSSQTPIVDWGAVRELFPALRERTFLNSATMGQLPAAATAAVTRHFAQRDELAALNAPGWFDDLDRLRGKLGQLVHAKATDIAFIPSTAHGLAVALHGLDWQPGDRIVTLSPEFPNNTYAPGLLGVDFAEIPLEDLSAAMDERTRLVILSALNYSTGMRAPLREIRRICPHALLYVDGTQGCGALAFDVEADGIDLLSVHGYKWMLSPTGAGFLYASPAARRQLKPHIVGWRSHHAWRDWANLHHGAPVLAESAEKFEGYFPAVPLYCAMEESVDLFLKLGTKAIEARVLTLAAMLAKKVEALGGTVAHQGSPIVACAFPGQDATQLARELAERKIIVSARHGLLRVSLHLYNDEADIERFAAAMAEILA